MWTDPAVWLTLWSAQWLTFVLSLCRIGGMLAVGPMVGQSILPWQVRIGVAVLLALMITPLAPNVALPPVEPVGIAQAALNELALGLLIGASTWLVVWSAQMAGKLIGQQMGTNDDSDADSFEPMTRWLTIWIAVAVLLSPPINGPWHALSILFDSLQTWPLGATNSLWQDGSVMAGLVHHGFRMALTIAAPMLATLMLCNLGLAMLGSATSSNIAMNSMSSLRPLVGLIVLGLSLSGINQAIAEEVRSNWMQHVNAARLQAATVHDHPL